MYYLQWLLCIIGVMWGARFLVTRIVCEIWVGLTVLPALFRTPGYLFENQLAQMEEHRRKPEIESSNPLLVNM